MRQVEGVREHLPDIMDEAQTTEVDRRFLASRVFLNPSIFDGTDWAL